VLGHCVAGATGKSEAFKFPADTFSFSNELYFEYQMKPDGGLVIRNRKNEHGSDAYSRHCFVLTRAILQFHNFAEFRPSHGTIGDSLDESAVALFQATTAL
jgi:hypothetical protein